MGLEQSLKQLIALLCEHPSLPPELIAEAEKLLARLSAGQLHLAVLGQFKRGKSTLINALLGSEILPSGVLPVTLVPVFLRFGERPEVEIRFSNGHLPECYPVDRLGEFVNEANNPQNTKHVVQVDLCYPSDLLQNGIVLIDTPGVGSTLAHNTETTLEFLPRCDAAIVVVSADPPITAAEIEFLLRLKPHIAHFFFVLNKVDYLDAADAVEAQHFLYETLENQAAIDAPQIFALSARQGLRAHLENDEAMWSKSGMKNFQQNLLAFAADGKQTVLEAAVKGKALNLVLGAGQLLAVEQQAMQMPLAELKQKIATFHRYAQNAHQQREEIFDRLNGDAARLAAQLEISAGAMREKARSEIMRLAETHGLPTNDEKQIDAFHQEVRDLFDREKITSVAQFKEALVAVLVKREQSARQIRENLREDASSLLEIEHFSMITEDVVVELAEPEWTIEYLPMRVSPGFGSKWLPKSMQDQQHAHMREKLVGELTIRNVEKIRWWLLQMLDESINSFRRKIMSELEETIGQIDRALQTGYQLQETETENIQQALEALISYRKRLDHVRQDLEGSIP